MTWLHFFPAPGSAFASGAHRHVLDIQPTDANSIHVQVLLLVLPGPPTGLEVHMAGPACHLEKRTQKESPRH